VIVSCPDTLRAGDAERVREVPSNPNHVSTVKRKDRKPGPNSLSSVRVYQNFPGPNAGSVTATAAAAARSSTTPGERAGEPSVCVEGATPVAPHPDSAATTQATETIDPLDIDRG
jgi:hypothetical protein